MNYPVWYLPFIGGPLIIAFVAIIHVVVSHFAVGGGLWLVLTEKKGYREKKDYIVDYVKKHSKFFLLLTMVFSALTGVGIWFTIALIHPDATSHLIHTFVFAWAIEWVLFVIEIVTAFLYFYNFGKISKKLHLLIGWIYFFAAWGSLLVINGILAFMLTPGKWLATQNFWDGIFNPSYLSSTVFRTFLCFALAGSYGLMTATVYYNTDMWATAGLTEADIPETWDEFREVAKKLTIREDGELVQAGYSYNGGIQGDVLGMQYQYGQNLFTSDNEVTLNNDAMKNVISRLQDMYAVDGVCDYNFGNNSGDNFGQEMTAMFMGWGYMTNVLSQNFPDTPFDCFEIPTPTSEEPFAYHRYNGESTFGVNKSAPADQQAAWFER